MPTLNDARKAMLHIERVTGNTSAVFVSQFQRELAIIADFLNEQVPVQILNDEKCAYAAACENSLTNAREVIERLQAKAVR